MGVCMCGCLHVPEGENTGCAPDPRLHLSEHLLVIHVHTHIQKIAKPYAHELTGSLLNIKKLKVNHRPNCKIHFTLTYLITAPQKTLLRGCEILYVWYFYSLTLLRTSWLVSACTSIPHFVKMKLLGIST